VIARAEQRRGDVEGDPVGDAKHEILVDDDVRAVAAVGRAAIPADRVISADVPSEAVLLLTGATVLALAAGVDHASHTDPVTDLVPVDGGADFFDRSDNFVTGDQREDSLTHSFRAVGFRNGRCRRRPS
jgi:hypothetical protein